MQYRCKHCGTKLVEKDTRKLKEGLNKAAQGNQAVKQSGNAVAYECPGCRRGWSKEEVEG